MVQVTKVWNSPKSRLLKCSILYLTYQILSTYSNYSMLHLYRFQVSTKKELLYGIEYPSQSLELLALLYASPTLDSILILFCERNFFGGYIVASNEPFETWETIFFPGFLSSAAAAPLLSIC